MSDKNKFLKKLNQQFTLRRILFNEEKSLEPDKKQRIREDLLVIDLEIKELSEKLKSKIPPVAIGK